MKSYYREYTKDNVEEIVYNLFKKGYTCDSKSQEEVVELLTSFLSEPMGISVEEDDMGDIGWSTLKWYDSGNVNYEKNLEYFLPTPKNNNKLVLGLGFVLLAGGICLARKLRG